MKFGTKTRGEEARLQMTSMIDIVFLLLIFFLVGTKFRVPQGELDAFLPREEPQQTPPDVPLDEIRVTLQVAGGGAGNPSVPPVVYVDEERVRGGMLGLEDQLNTMGRRRQHGTDKLVGDDVPVIIDSAPNVPYQWVIETLNICRLVPFKTVKFAGPGRRHVGTSAPGS